MRTRAVAATTAVVSRLTACAGPGDGVGGGGAPATSVSGVGGGGAGVGSGATCGGGGPGGCRWSRFAPCLTTRSTLGLLARLRRRQLDAFEPVLKWRFHEAHRWLDADPLVANLTDDNGDGVIDLCDVPDVVMLTDFADPFTTDPDFFVIQILVLSGADGSPRASRSRRFRRHYGLRGTMLDPCSPGSRST